MNTHELLPRPGDDPIRHYQARLEALIETSERLRPVLKACEEAAQRAEVKCTIAVGIKRPGDPKVEMMCVVKTLDELIPLFRELAKEGLRTDKQSTHKDNSIYDMIATREYDLGPCTIIATLPQFGQKQDERNCRVVQTGVQEVPKYEIVCDDDPAGD